MNKVALIFAKTRPDTIGIYIERAMAALNIPFDHFSSLEMEKIPKGYDLYFRIPDAHTERRLPIELKPNVFWVSDVHLKAPLRHMKRQVKAYDLILSLLPLGLEKLKKYHDKIYFLGCACDPTIHQKRDLPKCYDIGYVGTDGGIPRKFFLQELRERYPNSYIGTADYTKMSEIYSQSKIGFNYPIRSEGMTMRSFEIPACGTLQFMLKLPKPWGEDLGFSHKENIIYYKDFNELVELIDYYLKHDDEREAMAFRGYEHVRKHHTYTDRVREAFQIIQRELGVLKNLSL